MLSDALLLGKPPRALPGVTPTQGIWGDDDWAESETLGAMFAEAVASAQAVGDEERSAPGGAPSATVVGAMIVEQSDLGATLSGGGSVLMSGSSLPLVSRRSVWLGSNLCQQGSGLRHFLFRPRQKQGRLFLRGIVPSLLRERLNLAKAIRLWRIPPPPVQREPSLQISRLHWLPPTLLTALRCPSCPSSAKRAPVGPSRRGPHVMRNCPGVPLAAVRQAWQGSASGRAA